MTIIGEEEVNDGNEKVKETEKNDEIISIEKVRRVLVLLVESKSKLQEVEQHLTVYRGCSPNQPTDAKNEVEKSDEYNNAKPTKKEEGLMHEAKQTQRQHDFGGKIDPLVHALKQVLPSLLLCQANSLCELITGVLKDPKLALKNALEEQNVREEEKHQFHSSTKSGVDIVGVFEQEHHDVHEEEVSIAKAGLLIRLAREVILMLPIFDMAIEVLGDSLKECHGLKKTLKKMRSGTGG